MTGRHIRNWLNMLLLILAIISIFAAPFITNSIENPLYKGLAWLGFICLLLVLIIPIALTPYYGMREMMKDVENELSKSNKNVEALEKRLNELSPLMERDRYQRENPTYFMTARLDSLIINEQNDWVAADIIISSRLPYSIDIKDVHAELHFLIETGTRRWDMGTRKGEICGSVSGWANEKEKKIRVNIKDKELSEILLKNVKTYNNQSARIDGNVYLTTNDSKELVLELGERYVHIIMGGNLS